MGIGSESFRHCLVLLAASLLLITADAQLVNNTMTPESVLQSLPSFSTFRKLLTDTGVAAEINQRSSLTLLLPQNSVLDPVISRSGNNLPLPLLGDILRFHCLLQYVDLPEIRSMTNEQGVLITTLYQTTGRAAGQNGFLNISVAQDGAIHAGLPFTSGFNATLKQNITQFPYNISYIEIDQVLIPSDLGRPQAAAPTILNLTTSLQQSGRFNTFLSLMQTTGLSALLATLPSYSILAPTDEAFQALPKGLIEQLSPSQATNLLAYHTLPAYASIDSLVRQKGSVQTLASGGDNRKFLLQVSSSGGNVVSLGTGLNSAQIVSSVYDQAPAAAYSVNRVLLPQEIFVNSAAANSPNSAPGITPASTPVSTPGLVPVVNPVSPAESPLLGSPVTPPAASTQAEAPAGPVVDAGNLPAAAGPDASPTNTDNSGARVLTGATGLLLAAVLSLSFV